MKNCRVFYRKRPCFFPQTFADFNVILSPKHKNMFKVVRRRCLVKVNLQKDTNEDSRATAFDVLVCLFLSLSKYLLIWWNNISDLLRIINKTVQNYRAFTVERSSLIDYEFFIFNLEHVVHIVLESFLMLTLNKYMDEMCIVFCLIRRC